MYILLGIREYTDRPAWEPIAYHDNMVDVEDDIRSIKDENATLSEFEFCSDYILPNSKWYNRITQVRVVECKDIFEAVKTDLDY